jgi:23S rRNA-/tRNA-specific pseudouridylate synthase
MVVAKSERAYSFLKRAFKEREVDKRYHAVVQGQLDPLRGTVDAPIDRHPTHDYKFAVMSGGKPSITHYDTIEAFPRRASSMSASKPVVPTRSACISRRCGIRVWATSPTAPTRRWPRGSA